MSFTKKNKCSKAIKPLTNEFFNKNYEHVKDMNRYRYIYYI